MPKKIARQKNKKELPETKEDIKAETAEEKGQAKDKSLVIGIAVLAGLFLIAMLILNSTSKEALPPPASVKEFNGFVFEKTDNVWVTQLSVLNNESKEIAYFEIMFHHTPDEVLSVSSMKDQYGKAVAPEFLMNSKKTYITTEPDYPGAVVLGGVEIAKILSQVYGMEVKAALTKEGYGNFPAITCKNTSGLANVIYLKLGNSTGIINERECIVVQGTTPEELLKASDRLAFELLKII